jgi:putative zinc finger/helix-turn-helix YgiT family protein
MRDICPNCEQETTLESIRKNEEITVRGESVCANVQYYRCNECGAEFRAPDSADDPLDMAYREYRRRHGMLQPEEIRQFREQYDLTQSELASLLGWGAVTLSRYENGALQDEAHDTGLRLAMQSKNLLELVERKPDAIGRRKRERLFRTLRRPREQWDGVCTIAGDTLEGRYDPDVYSGYLPLNVAKFHNAMIYFCAGDAVPRTKLNKLLFYADFKHFKEYAVGITGARYVHLPHGPVPDNHERHVAILHDVEGALMIEERVFDNYSGEYLTATRESNLDIFSTTERLVLGFVKEYFSRRTASFMSDMSHNEDAYTQTRQGERISYRFAESLSV